MACFSLPIMAPKTKTTTRTCGECRECCIAYPLVPAKDFWPDGKKAYTPCAFLCHTGCSIHDKPRPSVCTEFRCSYLTGKVPLRPSESGVLLNVTSAYRLFQGGVPPCFNEFDDGLHIIETRPDSLLHLSARTIRYWFRKMQWSVAVVNPFGLDIHDKDGLLYRYNEMSRIGVYWKNDPTYAERVIAWWSEN